VTGAAFCCLNCGAPVVDKAASCDRCHTSIEKDNDSTPDLYDVAAGTVDLRERQDLRSYRQSKWRQRLWKGVAP
jgi:hypothetical protein